MSAARASKPRPAGQRPANGDPEPPIANAEVRQDVFSSARGALPAGSLPCVWMSAGLVAYKLCTREYECEGCPLDAALSGDGGEHEPHSTRHVHLDVRSDRRYTRSHGWVQAREGTRVRCGLDGFASRLLNRISAVVLPAVGSQLQRGAPACWLVDDSEPIALRAPIDGKVVRTNEAARAAPGLVASSPYDGGWLFEVEPPDGPARAAGLVEAVEMRRSTARDLRRLRRHLVQRVKRSQGRVGATMHDGGRAIDDPREVLGRELYHKLVRRFLR